MKEAAQYVVPVKPNQSSQMDFFRLPVILLNNTRNGIGGSHNKVSTVDRSTVSFLSGLSKVVCSKSRPAVACDWKLFKGASCHPSV